MYITCPKCNTSFLILPEQIGFAGRKVRCSKCSNIWHQKPKENYIKSEPVINSEKQIYQNKPGSGINLPALLPTKISRYLYALPLVLLVLIMSLSIVLFQDYLDNDSEDAAKLLNIGDINVTAAKETDEITITYKVVNSSDQVLPMPLVRVRLFDENNNILKSHITQPKFHIEDKSDISLLPKQSIVIKTKFSSVPNSTQQVDITLGSRLAFILR